MNRDCSKCIHNIGGGGCKKWDCEMETLAEHDKKIRADAIDEVEDKAIWIQEGLGGYYKITDDELEQLKEQKNE